MKSGTNFLLSVFQVTTTTKTIREIQYIGPDGQPLEYVPTSTTATGQPRLSTTGYDPNSYPQLENRGYYGQQGPGPPPQAPGQPPLPAYANYAEYPHRPPTPPSPSDRSSSPPPQHREPGIVIFIHAASQFHLEAVCGYAAAKVSLSSGGLRGRRARPPSRKSTLFSIAVLASTPETVLLASKRCADARSRSSSNMIYSAEMRDTSSTKTKVFPDALISV